MGYINRESAAFAWLVLFIGINIYWIGYDLWAHHTGHKLMTTQFRDWLHETVAGPLIMGVCGFVVFAFFYHMLVKASTK